jgi:2-oxo-4-hydroxy-4-carboxy--5-ureidoimidazoline (OHCU) decarboxylase
MGRASEAEQVEILDAHPRIGAPTASLSAQSQSEQAAHATTQATLDELARLNTEYEAKFGFKFIVFVNGRPRAELLPEFRARLGNERAQEMSTGMQAMVDIARARMAKLGAVLARL